MRISLPRGRLPVVNQTVTAIKCAAEISLKLSRQAIPDLGRLRLINDFADWICPMNRWRTHARERKELLRLLVRYFEATAGSAPDPACHKNLLAALRTQLTEIEEAEAAQVLRFRPVRRLVSFVFGRARAI